jgi:hypothetical protein
VLVLGGARSPVPHKMICEEATRSVVWVLPLNFLPQQDIQRLLCPSWVVVIGGASQNCSNSDYEDTTSRRGWQSKNTGVYLTLNLPSVASMSMR